METVRADLEIEVNVNCPKCDILINLLDERDTSKHNHNEEGQVMTQACPDGHWSEEHEKFSIDNVTCSECGETFNVAGLGW